MSFHDDGYMPPFCDVCGRFIPWADLHSGKAKQHGQAIHNVWDYIQGGELDPTHTCHRCMKEDKE